VKLLTVAAYGILILILAPASRLVAEETG